MPPTKEMTADSIKNCVKTSPVLAPRAFLIPISLVLSVTETSIIFIMPIPPTTSDIAAMAPTAIESVPSMESASPIASLAEEYLTSSG